MSLSHLGTFLLPQVNQTWMFTESNTEEYPAGFCFSGPDNDCSNYTNYMISTTPSNSAVCSWEQPRTITWTNKRDCFNKTLQKYPVPVVRQPLRRTVTEYKEPMLVHKVWLPCLRWTWDCWVKQGIILLTNFKLDISVGSKGLLLDLTPNRTISKAHNGG